MLSRIGNIKYNYGLSVSVLHGAVIFIDYSVGIRPKVIKSASILQWIVCNNKKSELHLFITKTHV